MARAYSIHAHAYVSKHGTRREEGGGREGGEEERMREERRREERRRGKKETGTEGGR